MATALGAKEEGLLAASWQWRIHTQVMLWQNDDSNNPARNFWAMWRASASCHVTQLMERHPPLEATVLEEVLIRCSSAFSMAAAKAKLLLGAEMRKETSDSVATRSAKHGSQSMREHYVDVMDNKGLLPKL
jgi:hypothetical protein